MVCKKHSNKSMHMRTPKLTDHKAIQEGILWTNIKLINLKQCYLPLQWFQWHFLAWKHWRREGSRRFQLATNERVRGPRVSSRKQYLRLFLKRTRWFRSFDGQTLLRKNGVLLLLHPTSIFSHQGSSGRFVFWAAFHRLTCLCFLYSWC